MKKLISICCALLTTFCLITGFPEEVHAETISFEDFVEDLMEDGEFDGNGSMVEWSPDEKKVVIQRVQAPNAQYQFDFSQSPVGSTASVVIKNTTFHYVAAEIPAHSDAWNTGENTYSAKQIRNAEFQFLNSGNVTIENCQFESVIVSPYGTGNKPSDDSSRVFTVDNCSFDNVWNAYALKDIYPASASIVNNTFNNCSGAIYFEGAVDRSNIEIKNNAFDTIDLNAASGKENTRGIIQLSSAFKVGAGTNFLIEGNSISGNLVKNSKDDTNHLPVVRLISTSSGLTLNGWTAGQPLSVLVNTAGAPLPSLSKEPQEVNGVTYTFLGWLDEGDYLGATATYPDGTSFLEAGNTNTSADHFYYAVWKTEQAPEPTIEPTATPSSTPEPSNDEHRSCDIKGDLNCDGVVTCDEAMGPGWVWSEEANACVLPTPVTTEETEVVGFQLVNTSDK